MVDQIRMKQLGAEIMAGLNKLQLPGVDLGAAMRMASSARAAVKQGQLGMRSSVPPNQPNSESNMS
jgi:arsenite methyltransferase